MNRILKNFRLTAYQKCTQRLPWLSSGWSYSNITKPRRTHSCYRELMLLGGYGFNTFRIYLHLESESSNDSNWICSQVYRTQWDIIKTISFFPKQVLNVNAHLTLKDLIRSHRKYLRALQFCGCTSADRLQFLCVCVCVRVCVCVCVLRWSKYHFAVSTQDDWFCCCLFQCPYCNIMYNMHLRVVLGLPWWLRS